MGPLHKMPIQSHMVQKRPCWRVNNAVHLKKKKVFERCNLFFFSPTALFAIHQGTGHFLCGGGGDFFVLT